MAPLKSVKAQRSHVATPVFRSAVHRAPSVARVPVTASILLLGPPFAARATGLRVQKGERCDAYQMRGPLIRTGVVQGVLLVVVRTGSG